MQKCKKSGTVHYYTYDYILRWPSDIFKYHTFFSLFLVKETKKSETTKTRGCEITSNSHLPSADKISW